MKQKIGRRLCLSLFALVLLVSLCVPASANSANRHWVGSYSAGSAVTDSDCPVTVEREHLTFDLPSLPEVFMSASDLENYRSSVTAEYVFSNPADYTVTATLAFPFGEWPSYLFSGLDENGQSFPDAFRYGVLADGEPVDVRLRHTYGYSSSFELDRDLARLSDELREDGFFTPDTPVTVVYYEVEGTRHCYASFSWDESAAPGVRVMFSPSGYDWNESTRRTLLGAWCADDRVLEVIFFGTEAPPDLAWTVYENGSRGDKLDLAVTRNDRKTENMTFSQYVSQKRGDQSDVSPTDWYNAVVDSLNDHLRGGVIADWFNLSNRLIRWYEYDLTFLPGATLTNTVTAPVYPSIDGYYLPAVYVYRYLLSPARTWASFGTLTIDIRTDLYLRDPSVSGFQKTGTGWTATLSGLPDGELDFSLCASESPERIYAYGCRSAMGGAAILPAICAGALLLFRRGQRRKER